MELPLERETEGFEKIPSLMGKSELHSAKRDGVILEERYCNEEPNITFFKILIGVTTCNIVVTL